MDGDVAVLLVVDADADVVVCLHAPDRQIRPRNRGFVQAHDSDYVNV